MEESTINNLYNDLLKIEGDYADFFNELKNSLKSDDYADVLNSFLTTSKDAFISKIVIYEMNKLTNKRNLQVLLDFLLSIKEKDFEKGLNEVDFTNLKIMCVKTIALYKEKTSVTPLLYCLNTKGENYKFRLAVAEALGKIGDSSAVDSLINVVKDEEEKSVYVRESAAHALGMLGDKRAIEPFLDILEGKNGILSKFTFLKERVLEALGKLNVEGNKRVKEALLDSLQDSCAQVRLNALESISNANLYELFDDVKELLNDEDEDVSKASVVVLYNLSDRRILDEILNNPSAKECCKDQAREIIEEYEEDE